MCRDCHYRHLPAARTVMPEDAKRRGRLVFSVRLKDFLALRANQFRILVRVQTRMTRIGLQEE